MLPAASAVYPWLGQLGGCYVPWAVSSTPLRPRAPGGSEQWRPAGVTSVDARRAWPSIRCDEGELHDASVSAWQAAVAAMTAQGVHPPAAPPSAARMHLPKNCPAVCYYGMAVVCPYSGGRGGGAGTGPGWGAPCTVHVVGGRKAPRAARTAALHPRARPRRRGRSSPGLGWVDLPGAYAPGGGRQGSGPKVIRADERGLCPSGRWCERRANERVAAMVATVAAAITAMTSAAQGVPSPLPSPARLPDGRPWDAVVGRLWCAHAAPCGDGASGGPRLGASNKAPRWWL